MKTRSNRELIRLLQAEIETLEKTGYDAADCVFCVDVGFPSPKWGCSKCALAEIIDQPPVLFLCTYIPLEPGRTLDNFPAEQRRDAIIRWCKRQIKRLQEHK